MNDKPKSPAMDDTPKSPAMMDTPTSPATLAAHAGAEQVPTATRPVSMPIYQTSVFAFPDLPTVDDVYTGKLDAFLYSRMAHPNADALERAYARLEGGEAALASASGMAAIFAVLFGLCRPGDHLVCDHELYGGTVSLLESQLQHWGLSFTYVDTTDPAAVAAAVRPETRLVYTEMISNPTVRLADVPRLAQLCRERGLLLVVDNTFATPYLARPLALGADVVVISATKFLGGHSDLTGGVAAGRKELIDRARAAQVVTGGMAEPFSAWLALRGIKTLHVRLDRQAANAQALAEFLAGHPRVRRVWYPGLATHPQHGLAQQVLTRGCGGMLSFQVDGGFAGANRLIQGLRMVEFVPSLGDVTTTVSHPLLTSHRALSDAQRAALGITPDLVRVSVGTEELADILADFDQALAAL
jgi:cystathionine gamma-synthase